MAESEKDWILNEAERQQVNDALEAILATEKFEAAPQMSAFLRYVVEQAADGNQNRIKAFTVAVDALGKPDSFDPQNDPVVRVLAGRLRAALTAYNDENTDATLLITMKPGSYVPIFLKQPSADEQLSDTDRQAVDAEDYGLAKKTDFSELSDARKPEQTDNTPIQETSEKTHAYLNEAQPVMPPGEVGFKNENDEQPATTATSTDGIFGKNGLIENLGPKVLLIGALATAAVIAIVQNSTDFFSEPDLQAATLSGTKLDTTHARARPDSVSIHITAVDRGNSLENSLNAVVSGVMSESEQINVFRILDDEHSMTFWPEDYILTLTTLDLPDETRINIQLMEAETGRVVHSQAVPLNEEAFEQLTQAELALVIDSARAIVNANGPLVNDYSSKGIASQ